MRTLRLDNSTLSAVKRCSTLAATRYHLGRTTADEAAPLRAGTAVHEALAEYFRTRGSIELAMAALEKNYKTWADERIPPGDRFSYDNVSKIVLRWCWAHPLDELPFTIRPDLVEVGAQALLTPEETCLCTHAETAHRGLYDCTMCACPEFTQVIFQGRLDNAPQGRDGRWYVGDIKTTYQIRASWLKGFELASQFTGYGWLMQQTLGQPIAGAFVLAIELGLLPGSTKKCATHKMPYNECAMAHAKFAIVHTRREPWQYVEWQKNALDLARRYVQIQQQVPTLAQIDNVRMEGTWIDACATCDLWAWCKSGRTEEMAEALLIESPWKPFDPAEAQA